MEEHKDCLACSESMSVENGDGEYDSLYCVIKNKVVSENDCCENFNI